MKSETGNTTPTPPSLSHVHKQLSDLQDEFMSLMKHEVTHKAKERERLAASIREHLHRARVLLLSTNVHDGLWEIDALRSQLDQLKSLLSTAQSR